jgi:hypothetical protein
MNGHGHLPAGFWAADNREIDDQLSQDDLFGGEGYPGLVSLSFIRSAIKRTAKVWCALGLVGFLAGIGLYVARPAGYEATTSLYMAPPPEAQQGWINDAQSIAETRTVAGMALRSLGLHESPATFVDTYSVVVTTNQILLLTVKASTAEAALGEARAVAKAFLNFRKTILEKQENNDANLQKQIAKAKHHVDALNAKIAQLPPSRPLDLHNLQVERAQAQSLLTQLKEMVISTEVNTETATTTAIHNSIVLDQAGLVPQSAKRRAALYGGGGLIGGLVLGLGTVVVTAIVSTRLRRRDDVARALGASVRLSIRKGRLKARRLRRLGLANAQDRNLSRMVVHMSTEVARTSGGFASLGVVPADDAQVAAVCLASLAVSCSQQGLRVVLADLCTDSPAAKLFGVPEPGVGEVTVGDARLVIVVPDRDDFLPAGPLSAESPRSTEGDPLTAACAEADVLLTLASLDPALGGDFIAEWTSSVIAVVTAGCSSAERVRAVGEMVRLAGIPQFSAVLIGADKSDESLGIARSAQPTAS